MCDECSKCGIFTQKDKCPCKECLIKMICIDPCEEFKIYIRLFYQKKVK